MMNEKKEKRQRKHWNRIGKWFVVLAVLLVGGGVTAGTIAYLQQEAKLVNEFTVGKVKVSIDEEFTENVKKNVTLTNQGNVDAYVRAKILVYYVDKDGAIFGESPILNQDYTMQMGNMDKFIEVGGMYYFQDPLPANGTTEVLIQECKETGSMKKDRTLVVDILGEGIQAHSDAVREAWGDDVVVKDGKLVKQVK